MIESKWWLEGRGNGAIKFSFSVCFKVFRTKMLGGVKAGFVSNLVKFLLCISCETEKAKYSNNSISSSVHSGWLPTSRSW